MSPFGQGTKRVLAAHDAQCLSIGLVGFTRVISFVLPKKLDTSAEHRHDGHHEDSQSCREMSLTPVIIAP